MAMVASSARSVNDVHYALLRHPPSVPLVLMTSHVDVILLVVGTLHMTSCFSLLAPYPTERLDVILRQKINNIVVDRIVLFSVITIPMLTSVSAAAEH
jgi:hypothetical protein